MTEEQALSVPVLKRKAGDNVRLAYAMAHAFLKRNPHLQYRREEFVGEALLQLVESTATYDEEYAKGGSMGTTVAYSTWVCKGINMKLYSVAQKMYRKENPVVSLDSLIANLEDGNLTIDDILPGEEPLSIVKALRRLSPSSMKFLKGMIDNPIRVHRNEILKVSGEVYSSLKQALRDEIIELVKK